LGEDLVVRSTNAELRVDVECGLLLIKDGRCRSRSGEQKRCGERWGQGSGETGNLHDT
jgi:hypothetical protein